MFRARFAPFALAALCASASLAADTAPIDVTRLDAAPTVDGKLDEPFWATATLVDSFVQRNPVEGGVPTERTEVRLAYTARALYVGVRAFEPDTSRLRATTVRRDDFTVMENDQFALAIDSFRDLRNGYWFSTNPLGVRVDAQFTNEGERFDDNWNGVWAAAAAICDVGWCAELEIPWATMRFREAPEVLMGINLFRRIPRTNEQLFAPLVPLTFDAGTPSVSVAPAYRFREIAGGARFDLKPFVLATYEAEDPGDSSDDFDGGIFVRFPVTDSLTVSGTVNADFSEVEVDDAQLNLTRFPLFLPEKRDFFLENAGLFAFGAPEEAELFFSRSIGLVPDEDGGVTTVPLDWGVKATAAAGRFELGLLSVETGDSEIAPSERFDVARARVALAGRTYVGGFYSRRDGAADDAHTTSGLDFSHYFAKEIRLQGFVARDDDGGAAEDSEADGAYVRLSRAGERFSFDASWFEFDQGFQPAIGLVARPGTRRARSRIAAPWFPAESSKIRRFAPNIDLVRYEGLEDDGYDEIVWAGLDIDWKSDFKLETGIMRQRELLAEPFVIYRDVVIPAGRYDRWEGAVEWTSDPTRPINHEGELAIGELYGGDHVFGRMRISYRPSYLWVVTPSFLFDKVELDQGEFTAWVGQVKVGITPSSKLRFDLLAQYESERDTTGLGLRARYDFREGTELIVAWDSVEIRDPLRRPFEPRRVTNDRGAVKFNYLMRL